MVRLQFIKIHINNSVYLQIIDWKTNVFNYLCHSNNIKNIQKLINHFATNHSYNLTPEIIGFFKTLSNLLENNPSIQKTE